MKKRFLGTDKKLSDQEIAELEPEELEKIISLNIHAWNLVLAEGAREKILYLAETLGPDAVEDWLREHGVSSISSYYAHEL